MTYLDNNATTAVRPEVNEAMQKSMDVFANASSLHAEGRRAADRIAQARSQVAGLINAADPGRIIFTSGGSESNNQVMVTAWAIASNAELKGAKAYQGRKKILISSVEHPCVMNSAMRLRSMGLQVIEIEVDRHGLINVDQLEAELEGNAKPASHDGAEHQEEKPLLVSIMYANNEIGTIQDVMRISRLAHKHGALFHTDAVQACGKITVDVEAFKPDFLTLSAHKIYGPKGVGALYMRLGLELATFIHGGHQEQGYRAGTYNNQGIIGFGLAAELAKKDLGVYAQHTAALKLALQEGIASRLPAVHFNGHPVHCLPNTLNVSFEGAEGEAILLSLDLEGIEVSTGSACASGSLEPSHVLMALGIGAELAHGSIRFSFGRDSSTADVDKVLSVLPGIITKLRRMSTLQPRTALAHSEER